MPAYKDGKTGKWYCKFYFEDWNGYRRQKKKSGFKTQREAKSWERDFLQSKVRTPQITISDLCDSYLKNKHSELKPRTLISYESAMRLHIKPHIGSIKAGNLTPLQVKELHTELSKTSSLSNVNYVHSILSAVMNYGVKFYGLNKNPCKDAGRLKVRKTEMRFVTKEEFSSLLPYLSEKYQLFFSILFWGGLRLGEARALTPNDIKDKSIRVNKNVVKVKGGVIVQDTPKTNNSIRTVEIHEKLFNMIVLYCDKIYDKDERIFPMSDDAIRKALNIATEKAQLSHIRIHDLRHSHVSLLIHMGFFPKAIAERIGDTVDTMLNVYSHVYKDDKRKMADMLQEFDN
ncbi:tyrosine-type recombinase/integrase [Emergencia timonensis]|uniref:site-specific integrase n=1 Tax=Emergencia timonensis TaxID=1776384 RepID=UPI0039F5C423